MMVNLPCLKGSCPNFLRPTCSYTECPLSFQTGSCPTEGTTAGYSSCLYIDFTDLPFYIGYGYSVDALPYIVLLVFVLIQYLSYSIVIGFLSRTLSDFRIIWNPAGLWNIQHCWMAYAAAAFSGRLISFSIFCGS